MLEIYLPITTLWLLNINCSCPRTKDCARETNDIGLISGDRRHSRLWGFEQSPSYSRGYESHNYFYDRSL
jgi:hypothetical protein